MHLQHRPPLYIPPKRGPLPVFPISVNDGTIHPLYLGVIWTCHSPSITIMNLAWSVLNICRAHQFPPHEPPAHHLCLPKCSPTSIIALLQYSSHTAARVIIFLSKCSHIPTQLNMCRWLPPPLKKTTSSWCPIRPFMSWPLPTSPAPCEPLFLSLSTAANWLLAVPSRDHSLSCLGAIAHVIPSAWNSSVPWKLPTFQLLLKIYFLRKLSWTASWPFSPLN